MSELNEKELEELVCAARQTRGGKPAKYPSLEKYGESILKLIDSDVQLPFILKWLVEEKGEKLVLNTLRKYVIRKIGRNRYEKYLARNGWMKNKRAKAGEPKAAEGATKTGGGNGLDYSFDLHKPKTFKRTER